MIVLLKSAGEGLGAEEADLNGDSKQAEEVGRTRPDFVDGMGATAPLRLQFGPDAHLGYGATTVTPDDTKAVRPHPFKRFLFPLDWNAKTEQAQAATGVRESVIRSAAFDDWDAGIAIEAIGVGNEGPEGLGAGFEMPFPAVVKFLEGRGGGPGLGLRGVRSDTCLHSLTIG